MAFVVSFLGSLLLVLFPNYSSYIISLFLIGCGMAMLQVVINPLLRTSGGEENYAFNSVLAQLIFGAASFISPHVYSYLVVNLANKGKLIRCKKFLPLLFPQIFLDLTLLAIYNSKFDHVYCYYCITFSKSDP